MLRLTPLAVGLSLLAGSAYAASVPVRYGDLNADSQVTIADVQQCLRGIALGFEPAAPEAADVAPIQTDGTFGDGRVDLQDLVRLLRHVGGVDKAAFPGVYGTGFEQGLEGWEPGGTDLTDPVVEWSITPSSEAAFAGAGSARFFLDNMNDAGKIWLQRPFAVQPNTRYRATVSFHLRSTDIGDMNLWKVIGFAGPSAPGDNSSLQRFEETGIGEQQPPVWLERSFAIEAASGPDGVLWIAAGLWGTFEVARTYYMDDLRVSLDPLPGAPDGGTKG